MAELRLLGDDGELRVFGEHDDNTLQQARNCVAQEEGAIGALSADGHFGYGAPIGMNVAYREHVSPAAVGYDIGCGNLAVATSILARDIRKDLPAIADRIFAEVAFGMGRRDGKVSDHPVFDAIAQAAFAPQRRLLGEARKQLGTVGAGNHYVDLFEDEATGRVWIGIHFGSRGFGHKTASGFLAMIDEDERRARGEGDYLGKPLTDYFFSRGVEGEMAAPPKVIRADSWLGEAYIEAMTLAGQYAYAGREVVAEQVLAILGAQEVDRVHNHHNYAWREEHDGEWWWVIRKGATPAAPGQRGFVGATMGEPSVILRGVESLDSALGLYSTVHGAGRAMSRARAAGKSRKRWSCQNRDCDWVQPPFTHKPEDGRCPSCGYDRLSKRWVQETQGAIDWAATVADLRRKGIELRGANAEEAPGAYKRLDAVLAAHQGTVEVEHVLKPLVVAMAPGDVRDPYKD